MLEQQHNYRMFGRGVAEELTLTMSLDVRGSPYGGTSASDSEGDGHQASRSKGFRTFFCSLLTITRRSIS